MSKSKTVKKSPSKKKNRHSVAHSSMSKGTVFSIFLFLFAFFEAFLHPLPTEFLFLPLALIFPTYIFQFFTAASLGSAIGLLFSLWLGENYFLLCERIFNFWGINMFEYQGLFAKWGDNISLYVPLSLRPLLGFSLSGGMTGVNSYIFVTTVLLLRILRYLLLSLLILKYYPNFNQKK